MKRTRIFCAWLVAALALGASETPAQQVFVRTDATSVAGVVSRSDLVLAELDAEAFSAPLFRFAGHEESIGGAVFTDTACVWGTTPNDPTLPIHEIVELPLVFRPHRAVRRLDVDGAVRMVKATPPNAPVQKIAVWIDSKLPAVLVFERDGDGSYLANKPQRFEPSGAPIDMAWVAHAESWAVLCGPPERATVEWIRASPPMSIPVPMGHSLPARRIAALDGMLVIVASGHDTERADGAASTSVQAVDLESGTMSGVLVLPGGLLTAADAVYVSGARSLWVTTESRGTASAVASLVDCTDGLRVQTTVTLPAATSGYHVAMEPAGDTVLFAAGSELRAFSGEGKQLAATTFEAPLSALVWERNIGLAAEGNRVHRLTDEGSPRSTVSLSTGLVRGVSLGAESLPGLGDADGDAVLDTIDATPGEPVPGLVTPRTVTVRRTYSGSVARAVPLDLTASLRGFSYQVTVPERSGLAIDPLEGTLPGTLEIALEPAHWAERASGLEPVPVTVALRRTGAPETLSQATLHVMIEPAAEVHGRVLVVPTEPGDAMESIRPLLSKPPQYYSVTVDSRPSPESLRDYHVVLISLEAVLTGRVPRVILEQFTARGGGLLVAGSAQSKARVDEAREWLAPFGIDVRPAAAALRAVREDCDWCDVWAGAGLREGLLASVEPPGAALLMPGRAAREGPMTRSPLGLGRLVFVGSDGLFSAATDSPQVEALVLEAVRWLMRTRTDVLDIDGDGLADEVEDSNRNGVVDPGETDFARADSDGDGVIDGLEDLNGNGRVDQGETDPRNPDTDGDRIPDGADAAPLLRSSYGR